MSSPCSKANMSCKVILRGDGVESRPLFRRAVEHEAAKPLFAPAQAPGPDDAQRVQAKVLGERVAQLEAALQRDVVHARECALREGEMAGRDQARAELQPVIERLNKSLAEIAGIRARIRSESERELVDLALCIARRILRRELSVDPDAVQGLVRAALDKVQGREIRRVRVHPDFLVVVRRQLELTGIMAVAEVAADPGLHPGDVVVETRVGDLDASIDSQLKEIERGFADRLNYKP